MKQAKHALEQLSADPDARRQAERREMALQMWEADMAKVRREGIEEGRFDGKVGLLVRVLTLKFGELSPATIQRLRTATEASLDSWSEHFVSAATLDDVFTQR